MRVRAADIIVRRPHGASRCVGREDEMAERSNEDRVRADVAPHQAHHDGADGQMRDPNWVQELPGTGEPVRGNANDAAIMANWPGGLPEAGTNVRIAGDQDRWVDTPSMTLQRVVGNGDTRRAASVEWFDAAPAESLQDDPLR
jgi:hypothetical protein